MIEKLFRKLGYVRIEDITYEVHLNEVCKGIGDPTEYTITEELQNDFMQSMSQIPDIDRFLDATLAADMQREFSCENDDQRHITKGAFRRTLYFKKGIINARKDK